MGQNTADNEVVQAMKKHTDSQHIFHLKNEGTGCYGIMLKQRDYYIYAYLPDTEVFHNLPLSVISIIFLYFLIFSIFWLWTYKTNLTHQKLELVNDVLDMSKLESGEIILEETPFNLSKISKEVLIVIEQIAAEQNIQIEWEKKEIIHRNLIGSPG